MFYNILKTNNYNILLNVQRKWEEALEEEIRIDIIEHAFKNINKMKEDSFTKYLQFRMLHRRIVTNKALCEMGIKEDNACPHCQDHIETIEHAFLQCEMAKNIWKDMETWLRNHVNIHIKISDIEKILGHNKNDTIVGKCILATKRVIYRYRQVPKEYTLREIKATLKYQMQCEEFQAIIDNSLESFLETWEDVYDVL